MLTLKPSQGMANSTSECMQRLWDPRILSFGFGPTKRETTTKSDVTSTLIHLHTPILLNVIIKK